jgi:hypothetical protein
LGGPNLLRHVRTTEMEAEINVEMPEFCGVKEQNNL